MKRKTTLLQESEQQPASRRRWVEENEEQADQLPGLASPPYVGVDDLIERVTNAVLQNYKIHNSMIMQVLEMFHCLEQPQLYRGQLSLN